MTLNFWNINSKLASLPTTGESILSMSYCYNNYPGVFFFLLKINCLVKS